MVENKPDHDPVKAPRHYTQGSIECIAAIEAALGTDGFIGFLRGQVMKYTWRVLDKKSAVQDSEKAAWYLARLTEALRKEDETVSRHTNPVAGRIVTIPEEREEDEPASNESIPQCGNCPRDGRNAYPPLPSHVCEYPYCLRP